MVRMVIVFNSAAPHERVLQMGLNGQRVLSTIPGVTDGRFGMAVAPETQHRYLFDIGFADEPVIEVYRLHPAHVHFAAEAFRSMARDIIGSEYRLQ